MRLLRKSMAIARLERSKELIYHEQEAKGIVQMLVLVVRSFEISMQRTARLPSRERLQRLRSIFRVKEAQALGVED